MRKEGTIVRWDDARGFGFIRSGGSAQDVFVHVRDFRPAAGQAPRTGLRVTFEDIHVGGKGPRAVAVQPVAAPGAGKARHSGFPSFPRRRESSAPARSGPRRADGARRRGRAPGSGAWLALPLMAVYAAALAWLVWQGWLPWWVLPASAFLNLASFFAYWQDKYAAQQRHWRIPEQTLHLWSVAGGWGGAWFAQQLLRHKSAKASFRGMYWFTVAVHCPAVAGFWWLHRS